MTKHLRNSTAVGFPDLVLAHRQRGIVFAEVKNAARAATTEQEEWLSVLGEAALVRPPESYLWRPSNWEQIKRRLT